MSFVLTAPELMQAAAEDLAGIRSAVAEVITTMAAPTTRVVPAAGDEVSAAVATMFGGFGREFQSLSAQAQGFHAEFVNLMNAGAGAYLGTDIANAEQSLASTLNVPTEAIAGHSLIGGVPSVAGGGVAAAGATRSASVGLLAGLGGLLGGSGGGGIGNSGVLAGVVSGLTGGGSGLSGIVGSLTSITGGLGSVGTTVGGVLSGLTGSSGLGGILGGLTGGTGGLGGIPGGLGDLGSLGTDVGSLLSGALPGLPGLVTGLGNSLTGFTNSLLPGLLQINFANAGPFFTGIAGPYEALCYNTWHNLQALESTWLADPFPFLRQFIANQMGYGHIVATSLQNAAQSVEAEATNLPVVFEVASQAFAAGNYADGLGGLETALQNVVSDVGRDLAPISTIPGHISQNVANVVQAVTNTNITPTLDLSLLSGTPPSLVSATIDNMVGLPVVFGIDLLGAPASALQAAGSSATAFATAIQAGNPAAAITALIDAPAVIANGFLNGQTTFPYTLSLSSVTGSGLSNLADVSVVANFPLDGLLVPPGYYATTVTVTVLGGTVLPPIDVTVGVGSTPFSGLLPFLVNYAPEQLAQAIGAPASPPPLISLPL